VIKKLATEFPKLIFAVLYKSETPVTIVIVANKSKWSDFVDNMTSSGEVFSISVYSTQRLEGNVHKIKQKSGSSDPDVYVVKYE